LFSRAPGVAHFKLMAVVSFDKMARRVVPFLALLVCVPAATSTHRNDFYDVGVKHGTEKVTGHAYHHVYNHAFHAKRNLPIKVLEIGLGCTMNTGSASIQLWQEYFTHVNLWMADIDTACARKVQNTTHNAILIGDQSSEADMQRWIDTSGGQFDLIVDDGSHSSTHQIASFEFLFHNALAPGGVYVMEDIESLDEPLCKAEFRPESLSRHRILYWVHELLKFPRNADVDLPKGLEMILCQREACAFFKCADGEPRCP
jgi:hypothetical protein